MPPPHQTLNRQEVPPSHFALFNYYLEVRSRHKRQTMVHFRDHNNIRSSANFMVNGRRCTHSIKKLLDWLQTWKINFLCKFNWFYILIKRYYKTILIKSISRYKVNNVRTWRWRWHLFETFVSSKIIICKGYSCGKK